MLASKYTSLYSLTAMHGQLSCEQRSMLDSLMRSVANCLGLPAFSWEQSHLPHAPCLYGHCLGDPAWHEWLPEKIQKLALDGHLILAMPATLTPSELQKYLTPMGLKILLIEHHTLPCEPSIDILLLTTKRHIEGFPLSQLKKH